MKSDVFYWVLNLSIHGSIVCFLLCLLRCVRRIPRRVIYVLWLGPAVRLTVPFAPAFPWSFLRLVQRLGARPVSLPIPGGLEMQTMNSVQAADSYFPVTYRTEMLRRLFEFCALIWIIGAAVCVLTLCVLYAANRLGLRGAKPLRQGILVSDQVAAPGLVGIFRPIVYVPPGMDGTVLDYVEAHELVHKKRWDNLWRCVALLICCIHWFNPVVWICLRLFFADMELSCDERVIRTLDPKERKDYALALLSVAEGRDLFVSAFGGAKVRTRISRVLTYRRLTAGAALAFALLTGAVLTVLALG